MQVFIGMSGLDSKLPSLHVVRALVRCQQDRLAVQVGYYANLTQLIEHAVESNDGRQATIIGHSLGCLVSLYFIMQQPTDWLHKHVDSFIAISAPWAGSITALKGRFCILLPWCFPLSQSIRHSSNHSRGWRGLHLVLMLLQKNLSYSRSDSCARGRDHTHPVWPGTGQ